MDVFDILNNIIKVVLIIKNKFIIIEIINKSNY